ncbi:MAG: response regulator [Gemmatimonadetes bacterium]|nr:response regulator [Gemmatimonadota bacterium]
MPGRLLLVEDDDAVRRSLDETLREAGYDVAVAEDAEQALARLGETAPDVVLTDVRMPGMDGISLLKLLRERVPNTDVILMTAFDDMPTVVSAMREGAFELLVKPLRLAEVRDVLARVFEDRLTREVATQRVLLDGSSRTTATVVLPPEYPSNGRGTPVISPTGDRILYSSGVPAHELWGLEGLGPTPR